jgi:signal transduction histidine kinase
VARSAWCSSRSRSAGASRCRSSGTSRRRRAPRAPRARRRSPCGSPSWRVASRRSCSRAGARRRRRAATCGSNDSRGPDAAEFVASDATTRLAVGGILALSTSSGTARQRDAITNLVGSLSAQRLALEAERDVEAVYLVVPEARVVSRVPYVNAQQLRLRQRDARLSNWFRLEVLEVPADADERPGEAWLALDPGTGNSVLRVDQSAWLGGTSAAASVVVTVPLRAYLRKLAAMNSPIPLLAALVDPSGIATLAASQSGNVVETTLADLPVEVVQAIPTLDDRFELVGTWFALRLPVEGTRFTTVVAVPATAVVLATLRRAAAELLLVVAVALALGVLLWLVRRRVIAPAEQAVRDLSAAESLVRDITDGVPGLAVFKVTREDTGRMRVDFVSRGAAAVLGVPAVAISADWENVHETVFPEEVAAVRAACERACIECAPWQQEFRVRRRDEERWVRVEARASRLTTGVELVGSWRDVTESREHTELLADAHRRLIELADGVPGAVIQWRVTADGRQEVAFVGNRLTEIAGVGASDLYGGLHAFEQVQLAEDVDAVRRARQQAVVTEAGYAVEYRVMHPGKGMRWLREEAVSHRVAGCIAAFTVHITDVTQQRKEAGELRRAKEEAEMATRAKSVFLATMSHEIRTPMTGISGMIEVLSRTVLDADQRSQLGTIADSARALRRILDDVLDFSRIEAGKMTVEKRPISIDDVIEGTAGLYAAAAEEKGVRLRATVDPRIGELVMGDAVRLRQVLGNLLSNAVKFTARGSVRLAVTQESVTDAERVLRFEVTDTGAGIPYEVQPRLFAPFERGEHEITTQVGGTGLGLALVRRIVDLMEGTVELRSLPASARRCRCASRSSDCTRRPPRHGSRSPDSASRSSTTPRSTRASSPRCSRRAGRRCSSSRPSRSAWCPRGPRRTWSSPGPTCRARCSMRSGRGSPRVRPVARRSSDSSRARACGPRCAATAA